MKKIQLFLIFIMLSGCNSNECGELYYDEEKKLTYLGEKLFDGKCTSYYLTGEIRSQEEYNFGKDHGNWVFYYRNGQIQTKGEFFNGKRIGKWEYYYNNNKLWKINYYDSNGRKIGK